MKEMMNGGMGSMMWLGWLGAALIVILLIAVVVAAVRMLLPAGAGGGNGRMAKAVLIVLAVIGGLAVAAFLVMGLMHWSMMGGMMGS